MTESKDLAQRVEELEAELRHWKSNHAAEVQRARVLKERIDMPLERVRAYEQIGQLIAARDALASELQAMWGQKPVAWYCDRGDWGREYNGLPEMSDGDIGAPLYARPAPAGPVNARLLDTLKKCRDQFEHYVSYHINKGDFAKAASNGSFVMLANAAISEAEKQPAEAGD